METPVYIKIHNALRQSIEEGKWRIGERIPSERELAIQFSVSRMTLRQAVQTLVEEGLLERRVGSGTFIARKKVQEKVHGSTSFTDIVTAQGKQPSTKTVSYHIVTASLSEQEALELTDQELVIRMERIRYADHEPICYEVTTIPAELVNHLSKAEITTSFYASLENKLGFHPQHTKQTIFASIAPEDVAMYLKLKRGDAILRLRQTSYLSDGRPFEYVRAQYAGNRYEFYLEK